MNTSTDPEHAALWAKLTEQRDHCLASVAGLSDATLRRAMLPSGWTFAGMLRHLILDEERFWFSAIVGGDEQVIHTVTNTPWNAWQVAGNVSPTTLIADYQAEIRRSDAIIARTSLDAAPTWWPEGQFGGWRLGSLRDVMLHMISECACHAGHLDAARELLDGRQFLVLD